jgi:hypothetical protein
MRYFYSLLLFLFLCHAADAQQKKRTKKSANTLAAQKKSESFLDKQFWLGFKAGTNLTNPNVKNSFQVVQPTNYLPQEKKYDSYSVFGSQAGLEITFYIKGFSVSLQPTYSRVGYAHQSAFNWFDPNSATNSVTLTYAQQHRLEYLEWPLLVKYDLTRSKLRPFVQGGVYFARLINANTSLQISGVDLASGGINKFEDETLLVGSKDIFAKNVWGISAGVGVHYHLGNVRLVLDANYRIGMSLANKTENRYQNDRLAGIGEVPDNFILTNIVLSAGCVFPMRYISSGLKALDRK